MRRCFLLLLLCCLASPGLHADGPAFDLSGPKVDVHVKRGDVTLPISEVPNLLPGDRLWIHPDLPDSQSTRFVLVVAFLRGATNPPPPDWFTRVETWNRRFATRECSSMFPPRPSRRSSFWFRRPAATLTPSKGRTGRAWNLCSCRPGSTGRQLGPDARRSLPGTGQGHIPNRPEIAQRAHRNGGSQPGHQDQPELLRQAH